MGDRFKVRTIDPETRPRRVMVDVSEKDVAEALRMFLTANGVALPPGDTFVWGIEYRDGAPRKLTICVDERN